MTARDLNAELANKGMQHAEQKRNAWAAIREAGVGNLTPAADDRPSMLIIEVNGAYERRWFGQKLPKNSVPVGVINTEGRFVVGANLDLPEEMRRTVAALHGYAFDRTVEGYAFSETELSEIATAELTELAKEKHSDTVPPWTLSLGLAVTIEQLLTIHEERTGRITDTPDVVVSDYDRYDLLDLSVWMVDHVDEVSDADLGAFLFQGAKCNGSLWVRLVWARIGFRLNSNVIFERLKKAHTATFGS